MAFWNRKKESLPKQEEVTEVTPKPLDDPNLIVKSWGKVETLLDEELFEVRRITILPGKQTSLHRHFNRREYWWVQSGGGVAEVTDEPAKYRHQAPITSDKEAVINKGQWHRLINNSTTTDLVLIEFAIGNVEEEDSERYVEPK